MQQCTSLCKIQKLQKIQNLTTLWTPSAHVYLNFGFSGFFGFYNGYTTTIPSYLWALRDVHKESPRLTNRSLHHVCETSPGPCKDIVRDAIVVPQTMHPYHQSQVLASLQGLVPAPNTGRNKAAKSLLSEPRIHMVTSRPFPYTRGKQIKKTQDELQWIVAQRLLSALTIPGFS